MKRIIDIPKKIEEYIKDYIPIGAGNNVFCYPDEIVRAIANGTPIPDNATNGDIVQMIFPYYSYERNDYVQSTEDYIVDSMECMEHDLYFAYDWWNAPYHKGGKE